MPTSCRAFGVPWTEAQRDRLLTIGVEMADQYQAAGKTGHPLLWARARLNILATLDWMIGDDNAWRAVQDARVIASELAFGLRGEPTLGVPVDGGPVQFRGAADRSTSDATAHCSSQTSSPAAPGRSRSH